MQTSAPGNKGLLACALGSGCRGRGFTLLELMVVVAIVAITAAVATLALPDPATYRLEREGARLIAILESARAEARAGGMTVLWIPKGASADQDYQFLGLPSSAMPELTWMERDVRAQVVGSKSVVLGPEPVIGAQQVVLTLDDRQLVIRTDGLSPFAQDTGAIDPDEQVPADGTTQEDGA